MAAVGAATVAPASAALLTTPAVAPANLASVISAVLILVPAVVVRAILTVARARANAATDIAVVTHLIHVVVGFAVRHGAAATAFAVLPHLIHVVVGFAARRGACAATPFAVRLAKFVPVVSV